eukprot:6693525-Prymnesium_polylepis.2
MQESAAHARAHEQGGRLGEMEAFRAPLQLLIGALQGSGQIATVPHSDGAFHCQGPVYKY